MKIKILIGILIFLILVNLATIGTWVYLRFISPPAPRMPEKAWFWNRTPMNRFAPPFKHLSLEQQQQLRTLFKELRQAKRPLERQLRELHLKLQASLLDTSVTMDSLQALLDSLAVVQQKINKVTIHHFLQARQFLPPEQYQRLLNALILPRSALHQKRRFLNMMKSFPPKQGRTSP